MRGRYQSPTLTSVDVNPAKLGREAAALLIDGITGNGSPGDHRIIETQLIERESTSQLKT
jgi:DNA-binding LacI/PurR family transcriptional regulator